MNISTLHSIKKMVVDCLAQHSPLAKVDISLEHAGEIFKAPIHRPKIAVGISKVRLSPAGLGGYFGQQGEQSLTGSWAKITILLEIYTAGEEKVLGPYLIFEEICTALVQSDLGVESIVSGKIVPAKSGYFNTLSVFAEINSCISSPAHTMVIDQFVLKRSDKDEPK